MDYRDLKGSAPGMRVEDGHLIIASIQKNSEGYYVTTLMNVISLI